MPPSSSAERFGTTIAGRLARGAAFPYEMTTRLSLWLGVIVMMTLFGWGAWERRWMCSRDGVNGPG